MVVLVNLPVNSSGHILVLLRLDMFFGYGGTDVLVNSGLVLAILGKETGGCLLGLLHIWRLTIVVWD